MIRNLKRAMEFVNHDKDGGVARITSILSLPADPNTKFYGGKTILMEMCSDSELRTTEAIKLMIESEKVDLNVVDENGKNALTHACLSGNVEATKAMLASNRVDLNVVDENGKTALIHSCLRGNIEIAKLLLDAGANPNLCSNDGYSPLHYACDLLKEKLIDALLSAGADTKFTIQPQKTLLMVGLCSAFMRVRASFDKFSNIVEKLVDAGLDINATDRVGNTVLDFACREECSHKMIQILVNSGADVNLVKNRDGMSPLMNICKGTHSRSLLHEEPRQILRILINAGADASLKDCYDSTALIYACRNTKFYYLEHEVSKEIVEMLVNAGADINARDCYDNTALYYACGKHFSKYKKLKNPDFITQLINLGANCDIQCADKNNYMCKYNTPLMCYIKSAIYSFEESYCKYCEYRGQCCRNFYDHKTIINSTVEALIYNSQQTLPRENSKSETALDIYKKSGLSFLQDHLLSYLENGYTVLRTKRAEK